MRRSESSPSSAATLSQVAASVGFRRIEQVRIVAGDGGVVAHVTGVIHRHPRTVPVSIATARRLAAAGAPLHIDGPPMKAAAS